MTTHWLRAWIKPTRAADLAIGARDTPYLLRCYLIPRNRWLNIYSHEFRRDDDDRALHDHPWCSMSLAMSGTVCEIDADGRRDIRAGSFRFRSAQYAHRIALVDGQPAETLFVTGPVVRSWGFHCPRGWVPWQVFTAGAKGELVGRGCGED